MTIPVEIQSMVQGETRNVSHSFAGRLDDGELLTGTPLVVEVTTSILTLTNKVVSTAILTINKISVPVGEAVQFKVVASATGTYTVKITATTDASPAQTLIETIDIVVT